MRKFIVIGVGEFETPHHEVLKGEEFLAVEEVDPLDFVEETAKKVNVAFKALDLNPVGSSPLLHPSYSDLQDALKNARVGDTASGTVIHYIGHGFADSDLGVLRLPAKNTDLDQLGETSVDVGALINTIESNKRGPHVLLMLDVCNAGEATRIQALNLLSPQRRKAWVIGASTRGEKAFKARFTEAVVETLQRLKDGWLDIHPSLKYVPVETMASEISLSLTRICAKDQSALPQSLTVTPRTELHDECPPFFENPSYEITPQARLLMRAEAEVREFAEQLDEGLDAIHFATRATGAPHQSRMSGRCFFAGRETQLADLSQWMDEGLGSSLYVVTGSPGAGKSALIGVLVCLSHPDLHDATPSVASKIPTHLQPSYNESIAAVHARGRTLQQILDSIARQLRLSPPGDGIWTSAQLIQEILDAGTNPVIVVDALDEAVRPVDVMSNLLLPLSNSRDTQGISVCRMLVGTRPWSQFDVLLKTAERKGGLVDLDKVASVTVKKDLKQYVTDLLRDQQFYRPFKQKAVVNEIAESVASELSRKDVVGAFLIAGLFVHQIVTELTNKTAPEICAVIPRSLPEMLELHLTQLNDQHRHWLRPIMASLAHAKGEGMPAAVLKAAAISFIPQEVANEALPGPTDQEVADVLATTSFYLRHSIDSDGRTLYRLFHQALADHLLNHPISPAQRTENKTTDAANLLSAVQTLIKRPERQRGPFIRNLWEAAPPYLLRHAIQHALDGGNVDSLLLDTEFMVHAEPGNLLQLLGYARSVDARLAAAVYRTSAIRHGAVHPSVRRQILALDASRHGARELLSSMQSELGSASASPFIRFVWSTGGELEDSFEEFFEGHSAAVTDLTATTIRGNMSIVSASEDGSLRVCDLRGGWTLAHLETAHTDWILSLKSILVQGNPMLVTAGVDNQIMLWDFAAAQVESFALGAHSDWIRSVVVHEMESRPIAISAGDDCQLRIWDLLTRELIGDPLTGHQGPIFGLAVGRVGGNSIAVSSSRDGEVIVWDLSTRQCVHRFMPFQDDWVQAIAIPDGRTEVFLASHSGYLSIWNLSGFEEISRSSVRQLDGVRCMDTAVVQGESLAITCGVDGDIKTWTRGTMLHDFPFDLVGDKPHALSTPSVEGRSLALIGGRNGSIISLDLNVDEDLGDPWVRDFDSGEGALSAVNIGYVDNVPIVYTGDSSGVVSRWEFEPSSECDRPVYGHRHEVSKIQAVPHPEGDLLVSSSAYGEITVCDLQTGSPIHELELGESAPGTVRDFAVHRSQDRVMLIVGGSSGLTVWDVLVPDAPTHVYPRSRDFVSAVEVVEDGDFSVCISGHSAGSVRFLDLNTGKLIKRRARVHGQIVWKIVRVGPARNLQVASVSDDGAVKIWNPRTGERLASYVLRDIRLTAVVPVSMRGVNLLAVGYADGSLDFVDAFTGQSAAASVVFPSPVYAIDVNEDGLMVACFSQQISFMKLDG
ncbi:hypothetical protein ACFVYG_12610 [Streptomyces sp. NPDC058256]|uniref:hypothetical protein n=1 Tax=Streptomyces sp. NPDC058256 TaxID=3346408 RepID=UPI0036E3ECC5